MITINIPQVQHHLGSFVANTISQKLNTKVNVGRVDMGFLSRLIIDDVKILDQKGHQMLTAGRLTAKIDLAALVLGEVNISSAQLFNANLRLSKATANSPLNIQFAIDSLASQDTTGQSPLNLRINSLIVRNSSVTYDQLDTPIKLGKLTPQHLNFSNISAHVILKTLTDDSLNVNVKRLTFQEYSGLSVNRLAFKLSGGRHNASLQNFQLLLPDTELNIDSVNATYDFEHLDETLRLEGILQKSVVTPSDLRSFLPQLKKYQRGISLQTQFSYHHQTLYVPLLNVNSKENDIKLKAGGHLCLKTGSTMPWVLSIEDLHVAENTIDFISKNLISLPKAVLNIGDISLKGTFNGDTKGVLNAQTIAHTGIGDAKAQLALNNNLFKGTVSTEGINLQHLLDIKELGVVAADMQFNGNIKRSLALNGHVGRFDYQGHSYDNIDIKGLYDNHHIDGTLHVRDTRLSADLDINVVAANINDIQGEVTLRNLIVPEKDYHLDYLHLESGYDDGRKFMKLTSDFAHANLTGEFDYATLAQSVSNAVGSRLPTLPGLPPMKNTKNNFAVQLTLLKTDWMQRLLDIGLDVKEPLLLNAAVNDRNRQLMVDLKAPDFSYDTDQFRNAVINISSPNDTLNLDISISRLQADKKPMQLDVSGFAADNNLKFALKWDNNDENKPVKGILNGVAQLYTNLQGKEEAHVTIQPSQIQIEKSEWQIEPSDILYSTDRLLVDHFSVHNNEQNISIDGTASKESSDTLLVQLKNVEVAYILDLVNFDAVTFSGKASGHAHLTSAFNNPDANAMINVQDFKFQDGRMGTLSALVEWNKKDKQIDINAKANDGPEAITYINGYVSPEKDYIDLGINAHGTYLDFMHSFTESFISHITGHGTGSVRLAGPLSAINLTGGLRVDAEATITPLNTTYQLRHDSLTMVPNQIIIHHQPIYDRDDNIGYLTGAIKHQDLTNLSLDLNLVTDHMLAYDFPSFGDQSFYGTIYAAGNVNIGMKGDDVNIRANVTPLENSVFTYNAASTDIINSEEFISWHSHNSASSTTSPSVASSPSRTNIYMTFLVNATPKATMRLLMDARTGDYINLNGNGTIQATYYNKGAFNMQGTYTVESGTYDITIQNIINKKFQFQPGGTIIFGGDPYAADLNLQALYTVNGVSLSDLNIGNSFASNTVRVNCLMNIGGRPESPQVTFDLDLPNVNADEKQMVRSLLSSQQEMNQQVLYLLGIGRFYNQGQNNANEQQQGQTSLAMNSFLSGTLSTQINNVINQIVKNEDWNFGANISTGTEGWNNAEYEGIINGRMLNNRLLINGQFGYRDNATKATPSFIGDFDVRYLLTPSGNYALKVYNQTNDRYFTRSSLNTQGIGIIMKRDFNSLSDFFGIKKK